MDGGLVVGTLRYMAPEQLAGTVAAPSWDLWALAVMAYEMVTGALPFAPETPLEYQLAVMGGRLTPVSAHVPDAPGRLQAFFARALALEPARRPARAPILATEFEHALR